MGFNDINLQVSGPQQPASTYKTKVLKGQVPFATQVTEPNIKYVIKHNFDLDGANVTIPENCILEFDGGSLDNGTLKFDMTKIVSDGKCFGLNINFNTSGWITNEEVLISWFVAENQVMLKEVGTFYGCQNEIRKASLLAGRINSGHSFRRGGTVNFEHMQLAVTAPIVFDTEYDSNLLKNGNLCFFSTEDGQSILHYNSDAVSYCPIENFVFQYLGSVETMDKNYENKVYHERVNAIRFEKAAPTTFTYWRDIRTMMLTGYIFVNQVYIQECMFVNIASGGYNGFISYNTDKYYGNKIGSSNILTFDNCNLNGGYTYAANKYKCTIEYMWDFANYIEVTIRNSVSQGYGITGQKIMRLSYTGAIASSISQSITLDGFWIEYTWELIDDRIYIGSSTDIHLNKMNVGGFVTLGNHENINIFNDSISYDQYHPTFIDKSEIHDDTLRVQIYYRTSTYGGTMYYLSEKFLDWMDKGIIRTYDTRFAPCNFNATHSSANIKTFEKVNYKDALISRIPTNNRNANINAYVSSYRNIPTVVYEVTGDQYIYYGGNITGQIRENNEFGEIVCRCAPIFDVTEENKDTIEAKYMNHSLYTPVAGTQAGTWGDWERMAVVRGKLMAVPTLKNIKIEIASLMYYNSFAIRSYDEFSYDSANKDIINNHRSSQLMPTFQIEGNNTGKNIASWFNIDNVIIRDDSNCYIKRNGYLTPMNQLSGYTNQRPTSVSIGTSYFDTQLNKPIYAKAVANDGTVTWVDATGATV